MLSGTFFASNRECLSFLFHAAAYSLLDWCDEHGFVPGVTAVLHTFGSTLNFHPHVHILVSDGGLSLNNNSFTWKPCSFFPEKTLKARFKYILVKQLRQWVCKKLKEKTLSIPSSVQSFWKKKYNTSDFFAVTKSLYKIIWYVLVKNLPMLIIPLATSAAMPNALVFLKQTSSLTLMNAGSSPSSIKIKSLKLKSVKLSVWRNS